MAVYMVTYHLTAEFGSYSRFFAELDGYDHYRHSRDACLIDTDEDVGSVRDRLGALIKVHDSLFVIHMADQWAGRCCDCSHWLSEPTRRLS